VRVIGDVAQVGRQGKLLFWQDYEIYQLSEMHSMVKVRDVFTFILFNIF
jgi:hypothetical protein